ncbi:MAG: hypothetical protein GXP31_18315 [Kiritimatiellaeota bacterium]|nr:hypothetical protein [Kiritimatiellota bacterium]
MSSFHTVRHTSRLAFLTCLCAVAPAATPHVIQLDERVLLPEDGLLPGNGDLSASVHQTADRIIWRFGKNDVWDRRLYPSDDLCRAWQDRLDQGAPPDGHLSTRQRHPVKVG